MRTFFLLFGSLVMTFVLALPASASQVSVSPVRVDLDKMTAIAPVTVYNAGDEVVVMETSMRIWNQASTGQWILSATDHVQAYPGLIRIQPKSSAVVRVGVTPGTKAREGQGTYRLFLRELVDPRPGSAGNVRMVLNINLPVFVGSASNPDRASGNLTLGVQGDVVNFSYKNRDGAATLSPQNAIYTWLDAQGETIEETQGRIDTYALPGGLGRWNQRLPVACEKVARVLIKGEGGASFDAPLNCTP